jgi:hypothetical protein
MTNKRAIIIESSMGIILAIWLAWVTVPDLMAAELVGAGQIEKITEDDFIFDSLPILNNSVLDKIRGGFQTDEGLIITFGISRTVFVNGILESQAVFNLPGHLNKTGLKDSTGLIVVQNGLESRIIREVSELERPETIMIVQNDLDNQIIQVKTEIDVRILNSEIIRFQRLGFLLENEIRNSLP